MMTSLRAALGVAVFVPTLVAAQVGSTPLHSPYRDLEYRQEFTTFTGWYVAGGDAAHVAPKSAPMLGAHYEFRVAGPAWLTARVAGVFASRNEIDPKLPIASRALGSKSVPMMLTDVGFALNLTGFKSWHALVPTVGGGLGMGAAFDGGGDAGGFKVGYPFLLTLRTGLKFASGGKWQGRLDATQYLSRLRYPESYFTKTGPDATVLPVDGKRTTWHRNMGLTLGLTYNYGR
jgi:hypothetical protein